jgi:hypothetical protein
MWQKLKEEDSTGRNELLFELYSLLLMNLSRQEGCVLRLIQREDGVFLLVLLNCLLSGKPCFLHLGYVLLNISSVLQGRHKLLSLDLPDRYPSSLAPKTMVLFFKILKNCLLDYEDKRLMEPIFRYKDSLARRLSASVLDSLS